jgi:aspartate/methionine/tyrosine aminotransferase
VKIETFEMERVQSIYENRVKYNLSESGVHPFTITELLEQDEIDHLLSRRLGYEQTNGSDKLRDAVSGLYKNCKRDNILVVNGSAEANFLAVWSLLEPGDELVFMLPSYMQIWGLARGFGITVKPFHLKEELHWAPDLDELRSLVTPKTKMIAVCNPNNPTGAVLDIEVMKEIVNIAAEVDAWVLSDEVYRGAELAGEETRSFYGLYDKVIVSCGLSKAYALPGLRIGWLAGPKDVIEKIWSYHDYMTISIGTLNSEVAVLALRPHTRLKIFERNRKLLRKNLEVLTGWANKHGGTFGFIPPKAGGIVLVRYNIDIKSALFMSRMRDEKEVFVVSGDCFGLDRSDKFIRIGIGTGTEYFSKGLSQIDEFLKENF